MQLAWHRGQIFRLQPARRSDAATQAAADAALHLHAPFLSRGTLATPVSRRAQPASRLGSPEGQYSVLGTTASTHTGGGRVAAARKMTPPGAFIKGARSPRRPRRWPAAQPLRHWCWNLLAGPRARRGAAAAAATRRRPLQGALAAVALTRRLPRTRRAPARASFRFLVALGSPFTGPWSPEVRAPERYAACARRARPSWSGAARGAGLRATRARLWALRGRLVPLLRSPALPLTRASRHSRRPALLRATGGHAASPAHRQAWRA